GKDRRVVSRDLVQLAAISARAILIQSTCRLASGGASGFGHDRSSIDTGRLKWQAIKLPVNGFVPVKKRTL
ncbi:hypothetical protein, partial [Mesorhizobium sp. M7A.F.Ca.CA.002.09.1.1]|uniref:hypothetical protein n=1 Tax=Mesorhizobium sp. M7A.F.Ca.CA.002.09.1.1 TaxID=2496739 RepID=UPI0019D06614